MIRPGDVPYPMSESRERPADDPTSRSVAGRIPKRGSESGRPVQHVEPGDSRRKEGNRPGCLTQPGICMRAYKQNFASIQIEPRDQTMRVRSETIIEGW